MTHLTNADSNAHTLDKNSAKRSLAIDDITVRCMGVKKNRYRVTVNSIALIAL